MEKTLYWNPPGNQCVIKHSDGVFSKNPENIIPLMSSLSLTEHIMFRMDFPRFLYKNVFPRAKWTYVAQWAPMGIYNNLNRGSKSSHFEL